MADLQSTFLHEKNHVFQSTDNSKVVKTNKIDTEAEKENTGQVGSED